MSEHTKKRGSFKAKLTFFSKYLSDIQKKEEISELDIIQLRDRLERIQQVFIEFEETQNIIECSAQDVENEYRERQSFEESFYSLTSSAKLIILEFENKHKNVEIASSNSDRTQGSAVLSQVSNNHIKLPTIHLPNFNGEYSNWLEFRDTYESLIHTNDGINAIQKFHYLRAVLEGGAAQVIRSLEFTSKNYTVAWQALLDRYNNNRLLVQNHVKALFNMEILQKESADGLRKIIDSISKNLHALEQLKQPTENWDTLIVYLVTTKLDNLTLREWEKCKAGNSVPSLDDFKSFLKSRADFLETLHQNRAQKVSSVRGFLSTGNNNNIQYYNVKCKVCNKEHYIQNCAEFLKLSIDKKIEKLHNLKLCLNCLRPGHSKKVCRRGTCKKCELKHHTLLHKDETVSSALVTNDSSVVENVTTLSSHTSDPYVLLSTAFVQLVDVQGKTHTVRVLLDSGSQSSYITKDLCSRLNLKTSEVDISVLGINQSISTIKEKCRLTIHSVHNAFSADITCFVIPQITNELPSMALNISELDIPKKIKLADPSFHQPHPIDMLIGSNLFWSLLCIGQISLGINKPILQKTRLGWIVSGPCGESQSLATSCTFMQEVNIQTQLLRFWELEECSLEKPLSNDDITCENHFKEHTKRSDDGRFIVKFPLKDSIEKLGDSYEYAKHRFLSLERKFQRQHKLKEQYMKFIDEYKHLGHMSKIGNFHEVGNSSQICYYMPHHGVIKEDSLTTKLRVVFDASAPSSSGFSFNNIQLAGPSIQSELLSILLRFRQYRYVVSGDVEKMYRQILISPEQRCLQRIIWRENPDEPLDIFELNTITYGTTSGAFLAIRCLFQLAHENKSKHPELSKIIESDFYVDDLLTGASSIEEAALISKGIYDILKQGGFNLRKFYSNNQEVLKYVDENDCPTKVIKFGDNENAKTLGLTWCPSTDNLMYDIKDAPVNKKLTKRVILSSIAQLFDPLGLLSPCIILAKILLQELWLEKVTWDESLPSHIHSFWTEFRNKLTTLNELRISRYVFCNDPIRIEMHGFADASEKAYGGCIFLRSIDQDGNVEVNLLCSKTKVAPLKTVTLPRLELSGAMILARLASKVTKALRLNIHERVFWSDSTIVLGWLKTSPSKLKTFVSNRVAEIQDLTVTDTWRHVSSKDNPADILSRGSLPDEIKHLKLWWHGPSWLKENSLNWPTNINKCKTEALPDVRKNIQSFLVQEVEIFPIKNFSKLIKLKRVVAWMVRFKNNCQIEKDKRTFGTLTAKEISNSFKRIIKLAQINSFGADIKNIENSKPLHRNSKLLSLNPFLDEYGILRVGGRLQNSSFSVDKRHPIILSADHHLTKLIFEREHTELMHAGPQQLLASLREQFWPIGGRSLAKRVVRHCIICFRNKPKTIQPRMGQLPEPRLQPGLVFNTTGIDYAGPLFVKDRKGRGSRTNKCYIGLFICFATKAVHLELITDLTKDSFMMALKRFISRRGKPARLFSDNGSNFIAARSELRDLGNFLVEHKNYFGDCLSDYNIQWEFIPPYSPHFGGIWEAGVKSSKSHLKRVVGNAHLTFEELNTVLVQVEAVLNSRPLFPLSTDPDDLIPLTPAHFLIGRPLVAVPDPDYRDLPMNRLSRLQLIQQCQQHFWVRWQKEYISELQQMTKWKTTQGELKIGSMVLIKDDNSPPLRWKLGRVTKLYPGKDGVSRVASIKTVTGDIKRSYAKLCPLPEPDQI